MDRGTLAKIDRSLLSGLGHDESYRMVRVPVSEATWSTWKRYCGTLGVSLGRAIAVLVEQELRSIMDKPSKQPAFLVELGTQLDERRVRLDVREHSSEVWERRLREGERRRRLDLTPQGPPAAVAKVGRNDPCPCGSGVKYKRCHEA